MAEGDLIINNVEIDTISIVKFYESKLHRSTYITTVHIVNVHIISTRTYM